MDATPRTRATTSNHRARAGVALGMAFALVWSLSLPAGAQEGSDGEPGGLDRAREVRTVHTAEFGVPRPAGVAFDPQVGLLVAGTDGPDTRIARLGADEDLLGAVEVAGTADAELATLAVDPRGGDLVVVADDELVEVPRAELRRDRARARRSALPGPDIPRPVGATFDDAGRLLVLDAASNSVTAFAADGGVEPAPIDLDVADASLRGLTFNADDGLLYVLDPDERLLYAFDDEGDVRQRYDLSDVTLLDPRAFVFAPSSDTSDDPGATNLFIADAGDERLLGGVTEVTLAQVEPAAVPLVSASLVQTIDTSRWVPASPDPSGVTYLPASDRLTVVDSEVNETTGAGYHGVNVWEVTRTGTVVRGWNTLSFTNEPTGVGHDPATNTLFIATDSGTNGIHVVRAGPDGVFGTSDDTRSFLNTAVLGLNDTEDPEFDPATGHLFFLNGVSTDVYRVDPVDGVFGNGNDVVSSFDVGRYGATDVEGLAIDQGNGTLLVGDRRSRQIYEVTRDGDLVRQIDARVPGMTFLSGMTLAPATNEAGRMNVWIVDRAVDNGADPNENDGKLFELSVPTTGSPPPSAPVVRSVTVSPSAPTTDDTLTAEVDATGGSGPLTYDYQWSRNGTPLEGRTTATLDLSQPGNGDKGDTLSVEVTASDGTATSTPVSSDPVTVVNAAPVFDQQLPDRSDEEGATVEVSARASDPDGDELTYTATGLPAGISIDGADGTISGTIAEGAASDSPYQVTVTADDGDASGGPGADIGLVQSAAGDQSGVNSLSLTFDQPPTPGNLLVAFGHYGANRTPSVPPGWNVALESNTAGETVVFYRVAGASEPSQVTLGASGAALFMSLSIFEYTGTHGVQSEVLDRAVFGAASGATTVSTGTTQTTRHDDELLLASVGLNGTRTFDDAWTNGFVRRTDGRRQTVAERVVSTTGQFETSESWTGGTVGTAVGSLVAFRAASDGSSPPPGGGGATATDTFTWTVTTGSPPPSAPVVRSVTVSPSAPTTDDTLTAEVDATGGSGPLTYDYQWSRNGTPLQGRTTATLDLSQPGNGDKGDTLSVEVTASDGTATSAPVSSDPVTVVNAAPVFDQQLPDRSDEEGATVEVSARASDPDGDELTYTATGLPAGISIGADGTISGTIAEGAASNSPYQVTVTANDGTVDATRSFSWTVTGQTSPPEPPSAPTGLTATPTSLGPDLDWDDATGDVQGYRVYRGTSETGPFTPLTASPVTGSSFRDTTAPLGTTSYYEVTTVGAGGLESAPAATSALRRIGFRAAASASSQSTMALDVPRPEGVVPGDVLLASVVAGGTPTIGPPAGWTLVQDHVAGTAMRQATYVRVVGANDGSSDGWTRSTRGGLAVIVSAYRGVDVTSPVVTSSGRASSAASTSITAPTVSTSVPHALVAGFFGIASDASITGPSATIEQVEEILSRGNQRLAAASADEIVVAAGSTGPRTATASQPGANVGHLVVLRPAGDG